MDKDKRIFEICHGDTCVPAEISSLDVGDIIRIWEGDKTPVNNIHGSNKWVVTRSMYTYEGINAIDVDPIS